jgi:hypothetical protein
LAARISAVEAKAAHGMMASAAAAKIRYMVPPRI